MKPEQEEMARELPYGGDSLESYHIALNELCFSCRDSYGNIYFAFQRASQPEPSTVGNIYQVARALDLKILHETFNRLSSLPNIDDVAFPIGAVHAAHMNTPEGIVALRDMLKNYYGSGPMVDRITRTVEHIQTRDDYVSRWNILFNPSPIQPVEYMDESVLPKNTEYPPVPQGVDIF